MDSPTSILPSAESQERSSSISQILSAIVWFSLNMHQPEDFYCSLIDTPLYEIFSPNRRCIALPIYSGSRESSQSLITNDFTIPSRIKGSSFENASAASLVLNIAMFPPSVNGPIPKTTPCKTYLSTISLWRIDSHDFISAGTGRFANDNCFHTIPRLSRNSHGICFERMLALFHC
jgi:hypothetical protein